MYALKSASRRSLLARVVLAAAMAILVLAKTPSKALADGALEWGKGGMFANIVNPKPRKKIPSRVARKIKKTNVGGIPNRSTKASRRNSKSRKGRSGRRAARIKRVRVASLGNSFKYAVRTGKARKQSKPKSITGGSRGVTWVARASCLNGRLKAAIYHVARTYGRVRVNSTCRSRGRNRRVGGASRSWHLSGNAADIRIWGNVRAAAGYLRRIAGGYKHYGGGLFHIDTGPRRSW